MRIAITTALLLLACGRPSPPSPAEPDAGTAALATTVNDAGPPPRAPDEAPPATFVEARRARLTSLDDEPGLARNADTIRAHFDGGLPPAMDLQAVALGAGRQGLMLRAAGDDPKPIALLVDADGTAVWTRERPLAGITPPVRPFTIAPRPDNGVAVFLYDEPTKLVAARMWTAEGAPFSDMQLFELPRCDAISAVWWPGRGWVVVTSFPGGARGQLLREEGTLAWDPQGIVVGEGWRGVAPATIVIDPQTSSWLIVQHATRAGADHVVALRYSGQGARLGEAADLGAVPHLAHPLDRVDAALARPGVVRVDVAGKAVELAIGAMR